MGSQHRTILKIFSLRNIIIPVVIGLAVIAYMMLGDLSKGDLSSVRITWGSILCFVLAILMVGLRDLGYMYRIRLLTGKELSWRKSFQVIFLWEFASSVTPSTVGGAAVAIFILTKEKLGTGKATAVVMVTALLDELFYIVLLPLAFILAGVERLSIDGTTFQVLGIKFGALQITLIGYFIVVLITSILAYGVFINPKGLKWILLRVTGIRMLRRFRDSAENTGNQIMESSANFRRKSLGFWIKAFASTGMSWLARFLVVNFLIIGFTNPLGIADHMLILARQLMMWIVMLISPTPGGSGIAEFLFPLFLREFIAGAQNDLTSLVALSWRLLTYYPYLIIGAIVLPFWLRRVYLGRKLIKFKSRKKTA